MTKSGTQSAEIPTHRPLSKRAVRRLIQRAFVLVGRERAIRQQLRDVNLTTLWTLNDWGLEWTATVERGKLQFHRGKAARPQVTYTWRSAEEFLRQIRTGAPVPEALTASGCPEVRKLFQPVFEAFCRRLSGVLQNPIDDDGESLL